MYDYSKILPLRLKYYREKFGYKQEDISKEIKINRSTYANWERGHRQPNLNQFAQIADIYNITLDDLLGRTDIKEKHNNANTTI